tara:strand:+ start:44 stop:514 length:471 start_codon:yes stop_codon:yes gene_type:complete
MLDNKKAQIGDTMTWVVATLVIIVVLGILVFATIWTSGNKLIFLDDKEKDFLAGESLLAFVQTEINEESIFNLLKKEELDKEVLILAENVFKIHKNDYQVFARLTNKANTKVVEIIEPQGAITDKRLRFTLNRIKLEDDKYVGLQLFKKTIKNKKK